MTAPTVIRTYNALGAGHAFGTHGFPMARSLARKGSILGCIYRESTSNLVYGTRLDRNTGQVQSTTRLFQQALNANEHVDLVRVSDGFLALGNWAGQKALNLSTNSLPPRSRFVGELSDELLWGPEGGLPSRVPLSQFASPATADQFFLTDVFDSKTKISHMIFSCTDIRPLEAGNPVPEGGGLSYYRILPDRVVDGPYVLVRGDLNQPVGPSDPGPTVVRGSLVLGSNSLLFLVWATNYVFVDFPSGMHEFDVFIARSSDGGVTWTSLDGAVSKDRTVGIAWNDAAFRVVQTHHNAFATFGSSDGGFLSGVDYDPAMGFPAFALSIHPAIYLRFGSHDHFASNFDKNHFVYRRVGGQYVQLPCSVAANISLEPAFLFVAQDGRLFGSNFGVKVYADSLGQLTTVVDPGVLSFGISRDWEELNRFYELDQNGVVTEYTLGPAHLEESTPNVLVSILLERAREARVFLLERGQSVQAERTLEIQRQKLTGL